MAERRMFAKTIIDSDAFLDMPLSTQALYFHLSMRADDEGFINNPKKIQRMIGASDDDMKVLIAKSFIISFESGIVVIKHWKIHNYIRGDRIKHTVYCEERQLLDIKDNGTYTYVADICQTEDSQVSVKCQDRLGKDRLGKDRLGKDRLEENTTYSLSTDVDPEPKTTASDVVSLFHEICKSYPKVRSLSDNRRKAINARLRTHSIEEVKEVFEKAENSSFLKGGNNHNWSANFDWLMNDTNFCKVLDGNYDNKTNGGGNNGNNGEDGSEYEFLNNVCRV